MKPTLYFTLVSPLALASPWRVLPVRFEENGFLSDGGDLYAFEGTTRGRFKTFDEAEAARRAIGDAQAHHGPMIAEADTKARDARAALRGAIAGILA